MAHRALLVVLLVAAVCVVASVAQTFVSPDTFTLAVRGSATPYPSNVTVSGVGRIEKMSVTLHGFSHPRPADMFFMLTSPSDKSVYVMSNRGGSAPVTNLTLTFDNDATSYAPTSDLSVSSTYRPTCGGPYGGSLPPPPIYASFEEYNGDVADGVWSLYVTDTANGVQGSLDSWSITFTKSQCSAVGLVNGGFETPRILAPTMPPFFPYSQVEGWKTLVPNGLLEIWPSGTNSVPAYEGNYMYANARSNIYQRVPVLAEQVYRYQFAHRGILDIGETVNLRIAPVNPIAQLSVSSLPIICNSTATIAGVWYLRSGFYTVPPNTTDVYFVLQRVCLVPILVCCCTGPLELIG
jgi:subtilisin-like proprotein convertase family protein